MIKYDYEQIRGIVERIRSLLNTFMVIQGDMNDVVTHVRAAIEGDIIEEYAASHAAAAGRYDDVMQQLMLEMQKLTDSCESMETAEAEAGTEQRLQS